MDNLYKEQLLEHYKHPNNQGSLENPDIVKEDSNPLCGDIVEIQLKLGEGKIIDAKFKGKGCIITTAAADILLDEIKGKTLEEVNKMTREQMLEFLGIELTTSRVKCAMLPLITIKKAIIEKESLK